MGQALALPQDAQALRRNPPLTFRNGPYSYAILTTSNGSTYNMADGKQTVSVPILWAVGYALGGVGQTYIFQYGGHYFESQVSFYEGTQSLGITMGHITQPPFLLEAALGYRISEPALCVCLNCHATSAVREGRLATDQMVPGVSCERCHGPGAGHISAVKAGKFTDLQILNPGRGSAVAITGFCGSCHRTARDANQLSVRGVANVRVQGYRLERSRCYNKDDPRISCTTCHDPHRPLVRTAGYYDARCVACHDGPSANTHACSISTHDCVTCHMPKVQIPGVPAMFTDHWIRVAKPHEPYPD
jgi:hypothetical protein